MNAAQVIESLGAVSITRRRRSASTYTNGEKDSQSGTTATIRGIIYPANGTDLQRLPEGTTIEDVRAVVTSSDLSCGPDREPDVLTFDSSDWQVEHVEPWSGFGTSFARALVRRSVPV